MHVAQNHTISRDLQIWQWYMIQYWAEDFPQDSKVQVAMNDVVFTIIMNNGK